MSGPSRRRREVGLAAVVATWAVLVGALAGPASSAGSAGGTRPVRPCGTLASVSFPDGSRVTSASEVQANGSTPEHCSVTVLVPERINVTVLLPTENWNGRYRANGGGVYEGVPIPPIDGLADGYATSGTDTGHTSALLTGEWAWSPTGPNYSQIQDFGFRANHEMAVKSKALIGAYYGRGPGYSYWNGCSSGGRAGLTEAMRYPADFDGILAAAPAINWTRFIPAEFWPQMVMMNRGHRLSSCKLQAFTDAAIKACDLDDGVRDGMFYAPTCRFDPKSLVGRTTDCGKITELDAQVVKAIWDGPRRRDGKFLWYGLDRGADLGALAGSVAGPGDQPVDGNPFLVSTEWLKWFIHKDPTWDWRMETYDQFVKDFDQSVSEWDYALGTNNPDLSGFKARGGKVLIWHGLADPLIFSAGTIDYYKRVVERMGGLAATRDFARLFMAPNAGHCSGDAPTPTDAFQAVVDWVERGKAPETLPAHLAPGSGVNETDRVMKRDLCLWPRVSVYRGSGPITDAVSFRCVGTAVARHCLDSRPGVRGRRLGPARLGLRRASQRRRFRGARLRARGGIDRYCLAGGGSLRIGYPTRRLRLSLGSSLRRRVRGRAVLLLTTSRHYRTRRVRVGTSAKVLRRRLRSERRLRVGRNVWYLAPGRSSTLVFKTRRGRVAELGLADKRLNRTPALSRRLLRFWRRGSR